MKETKKSLKFLFGSEQAGLDYMKAVAKGSKAPILFLQGPLANDMADWVAKVGNGGSSISVQQLVGGATGGLLIVKNAGDISDVVLKAAQAARNKGANVVMATNTPIKALDHVNDPAFVRIYAEDVIVATLLAEAASTRQALLA